MKAKNKSKVIEIDKVVLEMTLDEAVQLQDAIDHDIIWSETENESLYYDLYQALGKVV